MAAQIRRAISSDEVEAGDCIIDGSWEADMIIIDVATNVVCQIAEAIRDVANQKIIIITNTPAAFYGEPGKNLSSYPDNELQRLLPNSKLVHLLLPGIGTDGSWQAVAMIRGNDNATLSTVDHLLKEGGLKEVVTMDHPGNVASATPNYQ